MTIYRANANDLTKDLISIINKQEELILKDEKEITALKQQLQEREEVIKEAIRYLEEGHKKFTPHVTNSFVLDLIGKAKKLLGEK